MNQMRRKRKCLVSLENPIAVDNLHDSGDEANNGVG